MTRKSQTTNEMVDSALLAVGYKRVSEPQPLATGQHSSDRLALRVRASGQNGPMDVVVKLIRNPTESHRRDFLWEHEVASTLGRISEIRRTAPDIHAMPVLPLLHSHALETPHGLASISRYVDHLESPVTAFEWGRTLGRLHDLGSDSIALELLSARKQTNTLMGLSAASMIDIIQGQPEHPFHNEAALLTRFARELQKQGRLALALDPEPILAHRDLHPLNVLNTKHGGVAIDFQDASWGSRSDDWAWLGLLVKRFNKDPRMIDEARRGYNIETDGQAPTDTQIDAATRLRELVFIGYSIQHAWKSPRHHEEALLELRALDETSASQRPWQLFVNPPVVQASLGL